MCNFSLNAVFNKIDSCPILDDLRKMAETREDCVLVSARTGEGLKELKECIHSRLRASMKKITCTIPYSCDMMSLLRDIRRLGVIEKEVYNEFGVEIIAYIPAATFLENKIGEMIGKPSSFGS